MQGKGSGNLSLERKLLIVFTPLPPQGGEGKRKGLYSPRLPLFKCREYKPLKGHKGLLKGFVQGFVKGLKQWVGEGFVQSFHSFGKPWGIHFSFLYISS